MSTITIRLTPETEHALIELADDAHTDKSAVIRDAVLSAYRAHRERVLADQYRAAYADNPAYPFESAAERTASRARRNAREAGE